MSEPDEYGDYRVLSVLGEGGMGVVYLAEQLEPVARKVALKVVRPRMSTRDVLARFEAERQQLAALEHPNIAAVLDAGASRSGLPYFVMEYVRGVPITSYCDRSRLSVRERLELFTPVCGAVQHAHQKGFIHQGLKPSNVLITVQGDEPRPRVVDFGIAWATQRRLVNATVQSGTGRLLGPLAYTSPEQTQMTGLDVDTRTDVYALGVLLYELLVGALPFRQEELKGLSALYAVLETEPPTLGRRFQGLGDRRTAIAARRRTTVGRLARRLSGDLEWITLKAMAKDRSRRYESAGGLSLDLQRHLAHRPVLAHPPGLPYRAGGFLRRHRIALIAAAGGLIAASLGLAYLLG